VPGNAIEDKTLSAVSGGTPPDLVNLNPDFAQRLASKGALSDLSKQVPKDVQRGFFPYAIDATTVDGKLIGLPWYLSTQVAIYNKELLAKAGLKALPDTYRALAEQAPAFKTAGAVPFIPNLGDSNRILELFALDGVPLLSQDKKHAAFDTPEGRDTFAFWTGLFTKGILPKEALSLDNREIVDRFQSGQSAVLPAGPQFLKQVRENAPQLYEKVDVAPQIAGQSGKVGVGVMNLVVPTTSRNQEGAVALATFVTNAGNQLAFSKLAAILPSSREAAEDPFFTTLSATASVEDRAQAAQACGAAGAPHAPPERAQESHERRPAACCPRSAHLGRGPQEGCSRVG
jgi:putative chitobiose transport system substrate-binding protein